MRSYAISGVRTDPTGKVIEEALLHRITRDASKPTIGLQQGVAMRPVEIATLIARGDRISIARMSPQTGAFEAADTVRLKAGPSGYLQSYRDDGAETDALVSLPRYGSQDTEVAS